MGCAILPDSKNANKNIPGERGNQRYPTIDCRKKSTHIINTMLENVQIIEEQISDPEMKQFAKKILAKHNLFSDLSEQQICSVIKMMSVCRGFQGQYIFKEGDKGTCFFVIYEGKVEVEINDKKVRNLSKGDCFGELALIYLHTRSASVKSIQKKLTLLCLKSAPLKLMLQQIRKKNIETTKQLVDNVHIFSLLSSKQKYQLVNNLVKQQYPKDTVLFRKGEVPYSFYIIYSGKVKITFNDEKKNDIVLGKLESFGQSAFKPRGKRQGTAVVQEDLVCFTINQDLMKQCLGQTLPGILFHNIKKWALQQSQIFRQLKGTQIDYIATRFETKYAKGGTNLSKINSFNNQCLIINLEGRINNQNIGKLFNDQYFKEQLTNSDNKGALSKITKQDLIKNDDGAYAFLDYSDLKEVLIQLSCNRQKKKQMLSKTYKNKVRRSLETAQSNNKTEKDGLNLSSLEHIKKLGEGQFGMVHLVRDKKSKNYFAIKVLDKKKIKEQQMDKYVVSQRQILSSIFHPLILGFYKAYEDDKNIYFIIQYLNGIEMFEAIREIGILNKNITRFYFGSILLTIQYLHEQNIIYRDIKPENSIVTNKGLVMLIDLGTAKMLKTQTGFRTETIIGTPHYMAPEVMSGRGYSFQADYWSLGVLLYQFVCGRLPFAEGLERPYEIYSQIAKGNFKFPQFVHDSSLKSIIKKLLSKVPNQRTSSNTIQWIKNSSFFKGFAWDQLALGKMLSPYIPLKFRQQKINTLDQQKGIPLFKYLSEPKEYEDKPPMSHNKENRKQSSTKNGQSWVYREWTSSIIT